MLPVAAESRRPRPCFGGLDRARPAVASDVACPRNEDELSPAPASPRPPENSQARSSSVPTDAEDPRTDGRALQN